MNAPRQGFSMTAVFIHWILAVSIFFLFVSSWWMLSLPFGEYRSFPFQLHKNIGMSIFMLLFVLIFVRFRYRPAPETSPAMKSWMHVLALIDHFALYGLIIAVCVSGYLSSAFSGWGTTLWWVLDLPRWGAKNPALNELFSDVHLWTSSALLAVIAVHLSGAAYHAFRCDGVVRRMLHL